MESLSGKMEKTQSIPIEWCYFYEKKFLSHVVNCVYLYHQQPCILEERALWARRLSLGCRRILILTRTSPLGPWQCWHSTPCLTINETSLKWSKYSNWHKSYRLGVITRSNQFLHSVILILLFLRPSWFKQFTTNENFGGDMRPQWNIIPAEFGKCTNS